MKKVLSAILAGAMAVTMAVPALAAGSTDSLKYALDSDGEINEDVYAKSDDGKWHRTPGLGDVTIDGVVPNAEVYIALGNGMSEHLDHGKDVKELTFYTVEKSEEGEEGAKKTVYDVTEEDDPLKATHFSEDDKYEEGKKRILTV